ncbi:choice-of-anchor D domain-containing protein, partial [Candidatus Falkowbacteria bacterium]|nr:choice-of-anchor D domain-containing protein [Candidatus Falkowbacteria bacterium]
MKRFKTHNLFKLLATGLIFVQFFVVGSVGAVDSMDTDDDGLKQMTTDYTDVDGGEIREDANVGLGFEIDESQAIDISEAVPVKAGDLMQVKSFSGDGEVSVEKVEQMGAMEVGDKLMEYYDGIEENTMDYILYYLAQNQNEDGSFSSFNQYEITSEIGYLLARFNRRGSDEYQAMVDYLLTTAPSNNREKAIKARVLLDQGGDNSGLLTELMASRNSDGGVGLEEGYGSDVVTTLEVVKAFAKSSDFETGGAATQGLYYVLNQVEADGSMSYFPDGADSYYLVNKTLEYIKPFEGVTVSNRDSININVDEKINALLGFLNNNYNQETEELAGSGLVDELGMLYGFQLYEYEPGVQAMLWDNNISEQYANGSFGDFYYDIAALKVFGQGDLGITGLEALTGLINKEDALFGIVLENRGYKAVSSPAFYAFVDDFARYNPLIINDTIGPNETWILEWDPVNTLPFIGDTKFTFYIEAEGEINYENNWKEDVFNFAGSLDGTPATPLYVVAVKLEYSDTPAVFLQTPFKDDANRYAYRMIYRKLGDETWRSRIIDSQYGRFVTNLPEDEVWEFSIGAEIVTRGPVYYSEIVQVMTSSDNAKYTGDFSGYVTFNNQREQGAEVDGEGLHATYVESDEEGNFSYQNRGNGVTVVWAGNNYHQKIATRVIIPNGGETTDIRLITRFAPDTEAPEIMSVYISKSTDNSVPNQEEVSVLVNSVYDDYPKEADVYYYEPSDDSWNYISTTEFDFGVVSFDWYVPGALLGEGYKLKAIIWDWQGNVSEPMESDPFDVRQGGEASEPEPEIELGQATTTVASGGSFDVGSVEVGTSSETVFDIYNLGDADLVLNSSTTVVISGDDAGDFSVVGGPSDTIAPAGSSDFTLIFSPSLAGVKNVDLSISNNDNNENPYIVLIIGEGIGEASSTASEINVKEDGINISSGETLIFGNENTEEYIEKTLVIENLGDADLILGEEALVTIVGADANQFVIATEPETPI